MRAEHLGWFLIPVERFFYLFFVGSRHNYAGSVDYIIVAWSTTEPPQYEDFLLLGYGDATDALLLQVTPTHGTLVCGSVPGDQRALDEPERVGAPCAHRQVKHNSLTVGEIYSWARTTWVGVFVSGEKRKNWQPGNAAAAVVVVRYARDVLSELAVKSTCLSFPHRMRQEDY